MERDFATSLQLDFRLQLSVPQRSPLSDGWFAFLPNQSSPEDFLMLVHICFKRPTIARRGRKTESTCCLGRYLESDAEVRRELRHSCAHPLVDERAFANAC